MQEKTEDNDVKNRSTKAHVNISEFSEFNMRINGGIWVICDYLERHNASLSGQVTINYAHKCGDNRIGNYLSEYFVSRIVASYAGVSFRYNCHDFNTDTVFHQLEDPSPLPVPFAGPKGWSNIYM